MVSLDDDERQPLMTGPEQHPVDVHVVPVGTDSDSDNQQQQQRQNQRHAPALDTNAQLEIDESDPPTPRFIQDEGTWKRWKWVPYSVRRVSKMIVKWTKGPVNPQPYRIKPLFPVVQEYPLWLVDRFLPQFKHRVWLVCFYLSIWVVTFALVKRQATLATEITGWGEPQSIGCGVTYWGSGNSCGLDGNGCRPFNGAGFPFRCSADCESYQLQNPRAVGDFEANYRPLVVGGPNNNGTPIYRGDSFICGAAIHAGIISNSHGGCGVVKLVGRHENFVGSNRHGIKSLGFDSYFPLAFTFVDDVDCSATDMRWSLLAVSAVFSGVLSIFTNSPALFFFPNFTGLFWTVGMALDPPPYATIAGLFSNLLGKFLPAMFCVWVMYDKMGVRRTLKGLTAQFEKSVLWLGACWVGALDNYTLSFIPIQRLNKHDLEQQPGAKAALAMIVLIIFCIVVSQIWFFRQEGRLVRHLKLYGLFVGGIVISLSLPSLNLRIHHYILGLLFIPGTSLQTRPSLIYQGLLVGLFINGIARWGFDPVLQTPAALQGDAQKGSRLPVILDPIIDLSNSTNEVSNITFKWKDAPSDLYDGISILVNDVERFRTFFDGTDDEKHRFIWSRNSDLDLPEYFRFAYMTGGSNGDYTKAGTWTAEGEWRQMKSGPSKVKVRSTGEEQMIKR
ncbi:hypothetical protein B0J13DRAFT_264180 [Dactylonectria estremocensis]|uniref:LCCL domain-containing protein n=1 Tax=Dactylonectria estremocensis TaxID=1079267 RepID=A0A9P9J607_9HYPO|nr:hypothetical protein B0J13DRAFT_264180 [Dactylonectria estremocensis]